MIEFIKVIKNTTGFAPSLAEITPGKIVRFATSDRHGDKSGWCKLFPDGQGGIFGDWRHDISESWQAHEPRTPEERTVFIEHVRKAREEAAQIEKALRVECSSKSAELWQLGQNVDVKHLYIAAKQIKPFGAKQLKNSLLVPVRDDAGNLHGLQFIQADGSKRFKSGTAVSGCYCSIGKPNGKLLIAEGWATACTLHESTGYAVAVAFNAGNLKPVAEALRAKLPDATLIICADDDHNTEGNPGLTKASEAAKAVGGLLAIPVFKAPEGKTDFNDLHVAEGLERVKEIIEAAQWPAPIIVENVIADTWPEPVLFGEVETPEISSSLLPGYLGEYCHAVTRATQTPSGLAVMLALSAVAGCLQKRFEVAPYGDNYTEPLNLWTVTALESGNRKTAVKDAMTIPLITWENEQAELHKDEIKEVKYKRDINQRRIEQLKQHAARPETESTDREAYLREILEIDNSTPDELHVPRLWADDVTPERLQCLLADHNERMALLSDEGGIFEIMAGLYSGGKANLNVFLQGHAGSPVRVDRQGRTVTLQKPALTFGLAVQPDIIADLSQGHKSRFRSNGTLARFLYCIPKSTIGNRDVRQRIIIPESVKTKYCQGILSLLNIEPVFDEQGYERARILTLAPDALQQWETFSQWIESNLGENGDFYNFQDWSSKLPGAALRIAGLFHVIEYGTSSHTIGPQTMERSLDLCELLTGHARAAFDLMGEDSANIDAKHVYEWIVRRNLPVFRQNEAYRENRRFRSIERLQKALKVLAGRHIISDPVRRETGGRPSIWHDVNPDILKHI